MSNGENNDGMFFWCAILVIIFLLVPVWYAAHSGSINGFLLGLAKGELKLFTGISDEASIALERIEAAKPEDLSWETVEKVLSYAGSWIRWPYLIFLGLLTVLSLNLGRIGKFVRRLNMETLLRNNAESFPCLRPVVGRGKYLLSRDSFDTGNWRVARTPLQFALEQGLLLDMAGNQVQMENVLRDGLPHTELEAWGHCRFAEVKALEVIKLQLGKKYDGKEGLTPCRLVMAAALLAYAAGDKKGCVALLDEISESYTEENGKPDCPALEKCCPKAVKILETQQNILSENLIKRHSSYELPWFMALLYRARQKGVLATSQFIWLRPLDRPLWYALNQCGGRAAWAEGIAAWAHYMAEEKTGKTYGRPKVDAAVVSLREALSSQGWFAESGSETDGKAANHPGTTDTTVPAKGGEGSEIEPMPDLVLYEAEDDPEYDANSDPNLANEQV